MKVVELNSEHLRSIKVRELETIDLGDNFLEWEDFYLNSQFKKAIVKDDEVIVIMGGSIVENLCRTWLIASEEMYQFPIATMKLVRKLHSESVKSHKVVKFFTYNIPSFTREIKFLEAIGYKERELYEFEDGITRVLMVKEVI